MFAYKLLICCVIVGSACNQLRVCPALMSLPCFGWAGSAGKIVKTGLAVIVKWTSDSISPAKELLDWKSATTYFEAKVSVASLQCATPKPFLNPVYLINSFIESCVINSPWSHFWSSCKFLRFPSPAITKQIVKWLLFYPSDSNTQLRGSSFKFLYELIWTHLLW